MTTRREMIQCPRCEAEMVVEMEYEPADPSFGADADGNHGIYLFGYWSANDVPTCPNRCELDEGEQKDVAKAVQWCEENAPNPDDEWFGPDGPDEDC